MRERERREGETQKRKKREWEKHISHTNSSNPGSIPTNLHPSRRKEGTEKERKKEESKTPPVFKFVGT